MRCDRDDLLVEAAEGSDLWRTTWYGFVHDSGHALLAAFPDGTAAEVSFVADFSAQFDQAGLLVRADAERWVKAGVELSDGVLQLGAVVTREVSDWSVAPVPHWRRRLVRVPPGDLVSQRKGSRDGFRQRIRLPVRASSGLKLPASRTFAPTQHLHHNRGDELHGEQQIMEAVRSAQG